MRGSRPTSGCAKAPGQSATTAGAVCRRPRHSNCFRNYPSRANYDQLHFAGHHSEALLLGLFQVSALHNIVHLLFGVAGIALAKTAPGARSFLLYGGIIYLVLFVYAW